MSGLNAQIIGHDNVLVHLQSLDPTKAQSLLFEGKEGIGKKSAAKWLAAKILQTPDLNDAHPDFFLLEKSVDAKTGKEKAEISADDARKLAKFLSLTAAQSEFRVAIVDSADRLNPTAANAILKIVEEPPRNSVIILLAHEGAILPTIRSRCQRHYFRELSVPNVQTVLHNKIEGASGADLEVLAEIAEGSPGLALQIHENNGLQISAELLAIVSNPQSATYQRLTKFATDVSKNEKGWQVFRYLTSWLLNKMAKASLQGQPVQVGDKQIKARDAMILAVLDAEFNQQMQLSEVFNMDKKTLIVNALSSILRVPSLQNQ